jgi:putative ABC transport system permease protein
MMRWLEILRLRIRSLLRRGSVEQELEDEMRFHLEKQIERNLGRGLSSEEARHSALRSFGGIAQFQEQCRDERRVTFAEDLLKDAVHGIRLLAGNPGFTAVAVGALALGIGANTAIFSFAYMVLTRPVAVPELERLVAVVERRTGSIDDEPLSPANYLDLRPSSKSLEQWTAYRYVGAAITGEASPYQFAGFGWVRISSRR